MRDDPTWMPFALINTWSLDSAGNQPAMLMKSIVRATVS